MIVVLRAIAAWRRRRQRKIDLKILWPQTLVAAGDRENALDAFGMHIMNDPAWSDVSDEELAAVLEKL